MSRLILKIFFKFHFFYLNITRGKRVKNRKVFNRLVDLTERGGKIHLECEEYICISFMDKDTLEG